jgi:hypothetical protein
MEIGIVKTGGGDRDRDCEDGSWEIEIGIVSARVGDGARDFEDSG